MGVKFPMRSLVILSLALFTYRPLHAGCVDQQSIIRNSLIGINPPIGQSFVPAESEHLGFDLWLSSSTLTDHLPVTVVLHENDLDGSVVVGSTVTIVPPGGYWGDWIPFAFASPVSLAPGGTYFIELITDTSWLSWGGDHMGGYLAGNGYMDDGPWAGDFNFRTWVSCNEYLQVSLTCTPASGTLPLNVHMVAYLKNLYVDQIRQYAARIDVGLASGALFTNWRAGYLNLNAGWYFTTEWNSLLPALGILQGDNTFILIAEDVTPAPYNQPPYHPSGDTDVDSCTVTGTAP